MNIVTCHPLPETGVGVVRFFLLLQAKMILYSWYLFFYHKWYRYGDDCAISFLESIVRVNILLCLFREKYEDDNISRLRMKCVAVISAIGFSFIIMLNVFQLLVPYDQFDAIKQWRMDFFWNGNFVINLAILYYIIFKITARKYRRWSLKIYTSWPQNIANR